MADLLTRKEALEKGLTRYFTGVPCKRGHIAERYARHGSCCQCSYEDGSAASKTPERRAYAKKRREENPEKRRAAKIKHRYGVTPAQVDQMMLDQDNCCAICSKPIEGKNAHIDHSHSTGDFRGMLCFPCNSGLGQFQDDPELLEKAAEYLKKRG